MKALITGGEGYIGCNLAHFLQGHNVAHNIFDLKSNYDILDADALSRAMRTVNICFHLAAYGNISECERIPIKAIEGNLYGTSKVMDAAFKYGVKVIFASSFAIYHSENSNSVYGLSKALGERIVAYYGGIICRISNVYGGMKFTEMKDSVIARLIKGTFEDRDHGKETRDFIHVQDVCEKLMEATKLQPGTIADICTNIPISVTELQTLSRNPCFPDNLYRPAQLIIKE